MRMRATKNGIRLKAYAGTTGVLLAMNVTARRRVGLLGFAIERWGPGSRHRWLRGLLRFPGQGGERLTPIDSKDGPIQKFRWSDYSVYPSTDYCYHVHGVYGTPDALRLVPGGQLQVRTEALHSGQHQVIFNRAAAASQYYARRFRNVNPAEPSQVAARKWLARGLDHKILSFIEQAEDETWSLALAIYEIELDEIVDALLAAKERGAHIRVVYHARKKDKQTAVNEAFLERLADEDKHGRVTSSIFHQKFMVLSRRAPDGHDTPAAVLTGTTNFTPNGIYRQANVVHVVENADLASEYLALFDLLFEGGNARQTKRYINKHDPVTDEPMQVIFSPRSKLTDLEEVCSIIQAAKRDIVFCTTFRLHDMITAALWPQRGDDVIRYGLQNQRSKITGTHRRAMFVAKAYLKDGLEGFLKESTAKQRGNILIHLKCIVCDFTGRHPVVISGSNNFSRAGSERNDENMLILQDEPHAADTYVCEMMRLYDHYRFRYNRASRSGRGPKRRLQLSPNDSWTDRYFQRGTLLALERRRFCG